MEAAVAVGVNANGQWLTTEKQSWQKDTQVNYSLLHLGVGFEGAKGVDKKWKIDL